MSSTTRKSAFVEGILAGVPFTFIGVPFAMLFGILATEAGLNVAEVVAMSVLVIAGAAQFTAVQLMIEAAPVWAVLTAALAVNLRMAMYSASLQPYLGSAPLWQRALVSYLNVDASYALGILEYEARPERPVQEKVMFFFGTMLFVTPIWFGGSFLGAVAGEALPENLSLEFVMPILFLGLVGPMLKTLAHLGAALTSVVVALSLTWLPSGIDVLIAGLAAMIVGAEIERRRGR